MVGQQKKTAHLAATVQRGRRTKQWSSELFLFDLSISFRDAS